MSLLTRSAHDARGFIHAVPVQFRSENRLHVISAPIGCRAGAICSCERRHVRHSLWSFRPWCAVWRSDARADRDCPPGPLVMIIGAVRTVRTMAPSADPWAWSVEARVRLTPEYLDYRNCTGETPGGGRSSPLTSPEWFWLSWLLRPLGPPRAATMGFPRMSSHSLIPWPLVRGILLRRRSCPETSSSTASLLTQPPRPCTRSSPCSWPDSLIHRLSLLLERRTRRS